MKIPVKITDCTLEGEMIPGQKTVVVEIFDDEAREIFFVLKEESIFLGPNPEIGVEVIETFEDTVEVRPVAPYVPHCWGLLGRPPETFRIRKDSLYPG